MTLWKGHELATALSAWAALLAVLLGGQLNPVAWAAVAVVPLGAALKAKGRGLSTGMGGALSVLAVLYGVAFTMLEGLPAILLGAGYALFMLLCVRLLNRETPAHDLQLYAVGLLLMLDAAALNITWLYAPCFLVFTVSMVWALTTRELKRSAMEEHTARGAKGEPPLWREPNVLRWRFLLATAAIALGVLASTLTLFVLFPRVGLGILRLGRGGGQSGFSTTVRLGEGGTITQDNTVVMRVRAMEPEGPLPLRLYYRGIAFDTYDGSAWDRSTPPRKSGGKNRNAARMPAPQGDTTRYRITLEPLGVPYLFTAGWVERVHVKPGPRLFATPPVALRDPTGDVVLPFSPLEAITYEVEADIGVPDYAAMGDQTDYPPGVTERYLDVSHVSAAVVALAHQWVGARTRPLDKVAALAQQLGTFAYSLDDEAPPAGTPALDHFLFNRRAGHCEYFATALALMARVEGVPARTVGGYQGGALLADGEYLVLRQSDAHVWVEVFVPSTGWVTVDATPGHVLARPPLSAMAHMAETLQRLWEDYVVDYSLGTQIQVATGAWQWLGSLRGRRLTPSLPQGRMLALSLAGVLLAAALVWQILRRRPWRRRSRAPAQVLRTALAEAVRRLGGVTAETDTVREWVDHVAPVANGHQRAVLQQARDAYERARYGEQPLAAANERRWANDLGALKEG